MGSPVPEIVVHACERVDKENLREEERWSRGMIDGGEMRGVGYLATTWVRHVSEDHRGDE